MLLPLARSSSVHYFFSLTLCITVAETIKEPQSFKIQYRKPVIKDFDRSLPYLQKVEFERELELFCNGEEWWQREMPTKASAKSLDSCSQWIVESPFQDPCLLSLSTLVSDLFLIWNLCGLTDSTLICMSRSYVKVDGLHSKARRRFTGSPSIKALESIRFFYFLFCHLQRIQLFLGLRDKIFF